MTPHPLAVSDNRAMTPQELWTRLQIRPSAFYKYQARGDFKRFELEPRIGPRRYARKLVEAYLDREPPARWRVASKVG